MVSLRQVQDKVRSFSFLNISYINPFLFCIFRRSKPYQPDNKIRLSVLNEVFNNLMEICQINPSITTDDEILEKLLELDLVKLSYDTQNSKLINIDVIVIILFIHI